MELLLEIIMKGSSIILPRLANLIPSWRAIARAPPYPPLTTIPPALICKPDDLLRRRQKAMVRAFEEIHHQCYLLGRLDVAETGKYVGVALQKHLRYVFVLYNFDLRFPDGISFSIFRDAKHDNTK